MLRATRVVLVLLSAAVALLAAPRAATAQDVDKLVEQACRVLESGSFEGGRRLIEAEGVAEFAAESPSQLRKLCAAADKGRAEVEKAGVEDARATMAALVTIAQTALEAKPEDADAMWSLALARLARGRLERDHEGKPDLADWKEAAALLEKAWGRSAEEGRPAGEAASALFEGARLPGAPAAEMQQAADRILDAAIAKHPEGGRLLLAWATRQIERATAALATKKADAVAIADAALKRLGPPASRKDPDLDAATAYNDVVGFALDNKLVPKAAFVTKRFRVGSDLELMVPVSRRFSGDEESADPDVRQFTKDFQALHTLSFSRYAWDTSWDFGVKGFAEIGGDNLKGVANGSFFSAKAELGTEKTAKAPAKGRLNGRIGDALLWEVSGTLPKKSTHYAQRAWVFKSDKGNQTTYVVRLYEWREGELDAAMRSVLDSITESGKK